MLGEIEQKNFQGVTRFKFYIEATFGLEETQKAELTAEGGGVGGNIGAETKQTGGLTHHVAIYGNLYDGKLKVGGIYLLPTESESQSDY